MRISGLSRLGAMSTTAAQALVTQIFQTDFGRTPGASGLAFWVNALQTGAATTANIESQILSSASAADLAYYDSHAGAPPAPKAAPLPTPVPTAAPAPTPKAIAAPTPVAGPTYLNSQGQVMPGMDYTAQIKQFYTNVGMTATPTEIDSWNAELNGSMSLSEVQSLIAETAEGTYAGAINTANAAPGATAAQIAAAAQTASAAEINAAQYVSTDYTATPAATTATPTPASVTPATQAPAASIAPAPTPTPATATIASSVSATQSPSVMATPTPTSSGTYAAYAPSATPIVQTVPAATPGTASILPLAIVGLIAAGLLLENRRK